MESNTTSIKYTALKSDMKLVGFQERISYLHRPPTARNRQPELSSAGDKDRPSALENTFTAACSDGECVGWLAAAEDMLQSLAVF